MAMAITATAGANTIAVIYATVSSCETCFDMRTFDRAIAIPNIITGVVMLVMPLPQVLRLRVTNVQKLALAATFLHGIM